jgi:hypothetical protein
MNWQELKHTSLDDIVVWAEAQPWCRAMADCAQDGRDTDSMTRPEENLHNWKPLPVLILALAC